MKCNNFITFCQILLRKKTPFIKECFFHADFWYKWTNGEGAPYLFHASACPPASAHVQWKHWWSALDIHLPLSLKLGKAGLQWDEPQSKEQEEEYKYIKQNIKAGQRQPSQETTPVNQMFLFCLYQFKFPRNLEDEMQGQWLLTLPLLSRGKLRTFPGLKDSEGCALKYSLPWLQWCKGRYKSQSPVPCWAKAYFQPATNKRRHLILLRIFMKQFR